MTEQTGLRPRTRLALLAGVVTFLVLVGTGVGHAAWTTSSAINGTATATNAVLTANLGAGVTGITYPASATSSAVTIAPLTLGNTGGAPLALSLSATSTNATLAGAIQLRVWVRTGTSCPTSVPTSGVASGTLATPPTLTGLSGLPAPLGAGAATVLCLATNPASTVSSYASQTTTVTLTSTGSIGTNWSSTPTVTITQSVAANSKTVCSVLSPVPNSSPWAWELGLTFPGGLVAGKIYRVYIVETPSGPVNRTLISNLASTYYPQFHVNWNSFSQLGTYKLEIREHPNENAAANSGSVFDTVYITQGDIDGYTADPIRCGQ